MYVCFMLTYLDLLVLDTLMELCPCNWRDRKNCTLKFKEYVVRFNQEILTKLRKFEVH